MHIYDGARKLYAARKINAVNLRIIRSLPMTPQPTLLLSLDRPGKARDAKVEKDDEEKIRIEKRRKYKIAKG